MSEQESPLLGRAFGFKWTLYNTIGWALALIAGVVGFMLAMLVLFAIDNLFKTRANEVTRFAYVAFGGAAAGASIGACVGRAQQLVLRRHLPQSQRWMLASIAGGAVGGAAGFACDLAAGLWVGGAAGLMAGFALTGALQRHVLQEHVHQADRWIFASITGGALAYLADAALATLGTRLAVWRGQPDMAPDSLYVREIEEAVRQLGALAGIVLGTLLGAALVGAMTGAVLIRLLREKR